MRVPVPTIILGSASPRRKEILSFFTLPFQQVSSHLDEESIPFDGDPYLYACNLARAKAKSLSKQYAEAIIITADTVVYLEGNIYLKPRDAEDAVRILSELSGKRHSVFTALTVRLGEQEFWEAEETYVFFHDLLPEYIQRYYAGIACHDKAGSYAIQGAGSIIVRSIEGCYYNVMGMPINTLRRLLTKVDIDLWQYLKSDSNAKK